MKTERTQIHFLSDVLVAVASLDLKVPIIFYFAFTGPLSRALNSIHSLFL